MSDEYLAALGRTRVSATGASTGYLGVARAELAHASACRTNIEAKLRSRERLEPGGGREDQAALGELHVAQLRLRARARDAARASAASRRRTSATRVRSDLLPGFDIGVDYSLFEGSTLSDTARFKPYRERITASFSFSNTGNPFAVFARIFGKAVPPTARGHRSDRRRRRTTRYARAGRVAAGGGPRVAHGGVPAAVTQGWQASFNFTSARQRPPVGSRATSSSSIPRRAASVQHAGAARCSYDDCVARAARRTRRRRCRSPRGSPARRSTSRRRTTSLGSSLSFKRHARSGRRSWQTQLRLRAQRVRQPDRLAAARPARLARDLRLHAVAERQLRVQLPHLAEGAAGPQVRLRQGRRYRQRRGSCCAESRRRARTP